MVFPQLRNVWPMAVIASELKGERTVPSVLAGLDRGADKNARVLLSSVDRRTG
jgi:hypothetical protein